MKKKILASLLLSTVLVSQGAVLSNVQANTTDEKIAAQDSKISELTTQQKEAQKQVDEIQTKVTAIQTEQEKLQAENEKLQEESKKLEGEIAELSKNIVARNESLENQARSAQTNGTATSYINTIINSNSITEAISRVAAMSEIVSANNKMLQQQKEDKKAYDQLCKVRALLENHYKDMQDMEFTVEEGKLYMLQCRTGKRSPAAAFRMAVDMVNEGLITKEEAIMRIFEVKCYLTLRLKPVMSGWH